MKKSRSSKARKVTVKTKKPKKLNKHKHSFAQKLLSTKNGDGRTGREIVEDFIHSNKKVNQIFDEICELEMNRANLKQQLRDEIIRTDKLLNKPDDWLK